MGKTKIQYADEVSNPLFARPIGDESVKIGTFCEKPDPDGTCKNCWAEALNLRFGNGFTFDRANREKIEWRLRKKELLRLDNLHFRKPMSEKFPGHPLVVFTNDTYDIFQPSISDELRDYIFAQYDIFTNLTLLVQSTYISRMSSYLCKRYPLGMPSHYFIGMSAGTQKFLDDSYRHFIRIPAKRRYIIFEPILEHISLDREIGAYEAGNTSPFRKPLLDFISLLIIGGESGTNARPCDIEWVRSLVEQGKAAGVSMFVKQLGASPFFEEADFDFLDSQKMSDDGMYRFNDRKGGDIYKWPQDLRIREFPKEQQNEK